MCVCLLCVRAKQECLRQKFVACNQKLDDFLALPGGMELTQINIKIKQLKVRNALIVL